MVRGKRVTEGTALPLRKCKGEKLVFQFPNSRRDSGKSGGESSRVNPPLEVLGPGRIDLISPTVEVRRNSLQRA